MNLATPATICAGRVVKSLAVSDASDGVPVVVFFSNRDATQAIDRTLGSEVRKLEQTARTKELSGRKVNRCEICQIQTCFKPIGSILSVMGFAELGWSESKTRQNERFRFE